MVMDGEGMVSEPAVQGQGSVRSAEGLGPWVPDWGRSAVLVWDPAD